MAATIQAPPGANRSSPTPFLSLFFLNHYARWPMRMDGIRREMEYPLHLSCCEE